jgi:SNF2 family DNA or RNA helicase
MTAITLTTEYKDHVKARSVPGAYFDHLRKAWLLENPTPRGAAVALRLFPGLSAAHPELSTLRDSLAQNARPLDRATAYNQPILAPRTRAALDAIGWSLYDFQALDTGYLAAVIKEHGSAYLGWSMGLGKTLGACAIADELDVKRMLVVAPNTAKMAVWGPELGRFMPWAEHVVMRNTKTQREQDLGYARQVIAAGRPLVLVVHYESLPIILTQLNQLGPWDLMVCDEVHRIRNGRVRGKGPRMPRTLCKVKATHKLGLSGSIISNHAEELFFQLHWLFPSTYSARQADWNDRYLDYVDGGYGRICVGVKPERLEDMQNELGVFMVYRSKDEVLDLPERTEITRQVELGPTQRKAYDELKHTYATMLDSGEVITAVNGLVLLTRLRQVASGMDIISGEISDSSKLDLAVEMIEDNSDEAFVVFSWFKAAAYALETRLAVRGIESYVVTGDTKQSDRADYIARFQGGERQVFIGTLSTLGESVTLHRAQNAIFLDRSYNPSTNSQAADRIHRIGQRNAVMITHIEAKDTVDELRVTPLLNDKKALRAAILGGL